VSVVWHEIRKIWNGRALAIIVVLCALYFFGADTPRTLRDIRDPQGARAVEYLWHIKPYRLEEILCREQLEWMRQFYTGAIESDDLFVYAAEQRILLEARINAYITADPIFAEHGIFNNEDFWQRSLDADSLWYRLVTPASNFDGRKYDHLVSLETNLEYYNDQALVRRFSENNLARVNQLALSERQHTRITEVLENNEWHSELHGGIFWGFTDLVRQTGFLLIIASLVLHAPLVTNDRMRNMLPLQYHTKTGRRIGMRQFTATVLSSLMLATVVISVFAVILARSGVFEYWRAGITSYLVDVGFNSLSVAFSPISFGNYMLIMAALCYALCIGAAATAFALSRFSRNFITLTIKIVPVFAALAYMHSLVLPNRWSTGFSDRFTAPLTLFNNLYLRTGMAYLDVIIITIFGAVAVLSAFVIAWRDKKAVLE
jgi:hypothetical protein